jgi:hypothetical protein
MTGAAAEKNLGVNLDCAIAEVLLRINAVCNSGRNLGGEIRLGEAGEEIRESQPIWR